MKLNELRERKLVIEDEMYDLIEDLYNQTIKREAAEYYSLNILINYYNIIKELRKMEGF